MLYCLILSLLRFEEHYNCENFDNYLQVVVVSALMLLVFEGSRGTEAISHNIARTKSVYFGNLLDLW